MIDADGILGFRTVLRFSALSVPVPPRGYIADPLIVEPEEVRLPVVARLPTYDVVRHVDGRLEALRR